MALDTKPNGPYRSACSHLPILAGNFQEPLLGGVVAGVVC
jgi:hypothetical protein